MAESIKPWRSDLLLTTCRKLTATFIITPQRLPKQVCLNPKGLLCRRSQRRWGQCDPASSPRGLSRLHIFALSYATTAKAIRLFNWKSHVATLNDSTVSWNWPPLPMTYSRLRLQRLSRSESLTASPILLLWTIALCRWNWTTAPDDLQKMHPHKRQ